MTLGSTAKLSETEAIQAFLQRRDESSFRDLFLAVAPRLLHYFIHRRCSHSVAEDLTLETMYRAYKEVSSLRDETRFLAWLFTIARNVLYHELRKAIRELRTESIHAAAGVADRAADQSGFDHWLSYLDPEEQELLKLRYLDELRYEEIAAALAIPLGTVKWRIHNSKRKLAELVVAQ